MASDSGWSMLCAYPCTRACSCQAVEQCTVFLWASCRQAGKAGLHLSCALPCNCPGAVWKSTEATQAASVRSCRPGPHWDGRRDRMVRKLLPAASPSACTGLLYVMMMVVHMTDWEVQITLNQLLACSKVR